MPTAWNVTFFKTFVQIKHIENVSDELVFGNFFQLLYFYLFFYLGLILYISKYYCMVIGSGKIVLHTHRDSNCKS